MPPLLLSPSVILNNLDPMYGGVWLYFLVDTVGARVSEFYRTQAAAAADWKAGTVAWQEIGELK